MKRGGFSPKNYQNTQQMNNEQTLQIAPPPPCFIHDVGGSVLLKKLISICMKTRSQINKEIEQKKAEISVLEDEIMILKIESFRLCDDFQRYEEKEEEWTVSKRPKRTEKHLVGRIFWMEDFSDMDTGDVVPIQRSRMVRKDGVWLV